MSTNAKLQRLLVAFLDTLISWRGELPELANLRLLIDDDSVIIQKVEESLGEIKAKFASRLAKRDETLMTDVKKGIFVFLPENISNLMMLIWKDKDTKTKDKDMIWQWIDKIFNSVKEVEQEESKSSDDENDDDAEEAPAKKPTKTKKDTSKDTVRNTVEKTLRNKR